MLLIYYKMSSLEDEVAEFRRNKIDIDFFDDDEIPPPNGHYPQFISNEASYEEMKNDYEEMKCEFAKIKKEYDEKCQQYEMAIQIVAEKINLC